MHAALPTAQQQASGFSVDFETRDEMSTIQFILTII